LLLLLFAKKHRSFVGIVRQSCPTKTSALIYVAIKTPKGYKKKTALKKARSWYVAIEQYIIR
ncbi:MAG: hypothetical protein IKZ14_04895, partial [Muribaculaceae bacterium]|nr:hypothetical protein [Muribaculaceae bacterium]